MALLNPAYIIISGMQNSGNNGSFKVTTFGAGTFTVANASGVTESGSSGTGYSPSDSGVGVTVFGTANGLNGYVYQVGTNSDGSYAGNFSFRENWRLVSNVGTFIGGDIKNLPQVGDVIAVSVETQNSTQVVTCWHNGLLEAATSGVMSYADSSLSSGTQGINIFSIAGPNEYNYTTPPNFWSLVSPTDPPNSGTKAGTFIAGNVVQTQLGSDSFVYANGDLHTRNANWVYGSGAFTIVSDVVYTNAASAFVVATRSDVSADNDQYAEIVVTGVGSASFEIGPAVRVTGANYYTLQVSSGLFQISKMNNGTFSTLLTLSSAVTIANGDVIRLTARGNVLTAWHNGIAIGSISDNTYATGQPGLWGFGATTTVNGATSWKAGNYSWQQTISDNFAGPLTTGWSIPVATGMENTPQLVNASIAATSGSFYPAVASGVALSVWQGGTKSVYSVPDCRNFGVFPNNSINVQGTLTYTVPAHPSTTPPTDSRAAGAPVDSRTAANTPQNSRTPGTYGPGE